jgi:WD40 repeat protein
MLSIDSREVLRIVGNRLALFDYGEKNATLLPSSYEICSVLIICLSSDGKFLAAAVKSPELQGAAMLIYDMSSHSVGTFMKPRSIQFEGASQFTCLCFSNDALLLAACTDVISDGVIIFDRIRGIVLRKISMTSAVTQLSFNPADESKICATGPNNMFQFWRYAKTVHAAPIADLPREGLDFTCHAWLTDNRVVAGTSTGLVVLVQGCDCIGQQFAFGLPGQPGRVDSPVLAILVRGVYVVAASAFDVLTGMHCDLLFQYLQ